MSHQENTTAPQKPQVQLLTDRATFDEFFAVQSGFAAEDALNESSCLLAAGIALITELSGSDPVGEDACYGIRFILRGAKALLDSTVVGIERATAQGGTQ